jgi:hypothetical protein
MTARFFFRSWMFGLFALLLAACQKEAITEGVDIDAPKSAPTTTGDKEWKEYINDVVKRNRPTEVRGQSYTTYLAFGQTIETSVERAKNSLAAGVQKGIFLAYASPNSKLMADIMVQAYPSAKPGSMKGVYVLFIGDASDEPAVRAAVAPSGATFMFVEAK